VLDSKFNSSWGGWCSNEPLHPYEVGYGRILGGVGEVIPDCCGSISRF
jgi:hypothetical protein